MYYLPKKSSFRVSALHLGPLLATFSVSLLIAGCAQSAPPPAPEPVLRLDWLGTTRIATDTNAATPLRILSMPESVALKEQTLDKLASAPWLLAGQEPDTNTSALLRPLLNDLVTEECRFELAVATNQPLACALAIHLDSDRAALWESNLAAVVESFFDSKTSPLSGGSSGWRLHRETEPRRIAFTRSGEWTVLGAAGSPAALDAVMASLLEPIAASDTAQTSNLWLAVSADTSRLARLLFPTMKAPSLLPDLHASVLGHQGRTRTEATLNFAQPLDLDLQEWDVPNHLIDQPCSSITLCRGLPHLLSALELWKELRIGPPPEQVFVWGFQGQYMQSYFLLDVPVPSETVSLVSDRVIETQTNWFGTNSWNWFVRSETSDGIHWKGFPYMWPFLRTMETNGQSFVLGGAFAWLDLIEPLSSNFFDEALSQGEVVYYDWERTDQRITQWLYMAQFIRQVCQKPQLPFDSLSLLWLKAIDSELADSITRINLSGPDQLTFTRTSDLGFTAIELQLLADWLESPDFPKGLHTFTAPLP